MNATAPSNRQFVDEYLDRAMVEFDWNRLAVQLMRRLANDFPGEFTGSAMRYLVSDDESEAHRFLSALVLGQPGIFDLLTEPAFRSPRWAKKLLSRFLAINPQRDTEQTPEGPAQESGEFNSVRVARALHVLDPAAHGRRLWQMLSDLSECPEMRISRPRILSISRSIAAAAWAGSQLLDPDPRRRANAVEGLWGLKTSEAIDLFTACLNDNSSRVVGNALVGLHISGRNGMERAVHWFSLQREEAFRSTAAWAMARIGNAGAARPDARYTGG